MWVLIGLGQRASVIGFFCGQAEMLFPMLLSRSGDLGAGWEICKSYRRRRNQDFRARPFWLESFWWIEVGSTKVHDRKDPNDRWREGAGRREGESVYIGVTLDFDILLERQSWEQNRSTTIKALAGEPRCLGAKFWRNRERLAPLDSVKSLRFSNHSTGGGKEVTGENKRNWGSVNSKWLLEKEIRPYWDIRQVILELVK